MTDDQYSARIGDTTSEPPAKGWASVDKTVFGIAGGIILVICLAGVFFTDAIGDGASAALGWVTHNLGWLFILSASGFVVFALVLAFGRYGSIPLSKEGESTEFSTGSWVAMMFSAGMRIGLMSFGVYEPVSRLASPPPYVEAAAGSADASRA